MDNEKNAKPEAEKAKPEAEKAKPEEKLSEDDLEAVTGGLEGGSIRKRDVHGHPLTYGPEGYIVPLK